MLLAATLAVQADQQSERLIRRARRVASTVRTLQADRVWLHRDVYDKGGGSPKWEGQTLVRLMKPRYAFIKHKDANNTEFCICDGRQVYWIEEREKSYTVGAVQPDGYPITIGGYRDLETAFFSPQSI